MITILLCTLAVIAGAEIGVTLGEWRAARRRQLRWEEPWRP